jgi:hypothetical protein
MNKKECRIYIPLCLFTMLVFYGLLLTRDKPLLDKLCNDWGPIQNIGGFFLFVASILFFVSFFRERGGNHLPLLKTKKNLFFLLLGLLFFFGAGEEINWGQYIFHFQPPKVISDLNVEHEFNFHNLKFINRYSVNGEKPSWTNYLNATRLFNIFWFSFCLLIPLANRFSKKLSGWFKKINLPVAPLCIGLFFLANYLIFHFFHSPRGWHMIGFDLKNTLNEISETVYSFFFVLIAWDFLRKIKKEASMFASPKT